MHAPSRMPELAARGYRAMLVGSYAALCRVETAEHVAVARVFRRSQDYARLV